MLSEGERLGPSELGLLAAVGVTRVCTTRISLGIARSTLTARVHKNGGWSKSL